jgi:hypothetical protein
MFNNDEDLFHFVEGSYPGLCDPTNTHQYSLLETCYNSVVDGL